MNQVVTIDGLFPGLNEIIHAAGVFGRQAHGKGGKRWRQYAAMKSSITTRVLAACTEQRTRPAGRCRIHFHWVERNRRRDPDNIRAAAKFILDGLMEARVIEDDGWDEIAELSDTFEVDVSPRVVVTISPA